MRGGFSVEDGGELTRTVPVALGLAHLDLSSVALARGQRRGARLPTAAAGQPHGPSGPASPRSRAWPSAPTEAAARATSPTTERCGGGTELDLPAGRAETAPGTGSLFGYTWSDTVHSTDSGRPPSCAFATAVTGLGAQVEVGGFISRGVGGAFVSSDLTTPQFGVLHSILDVKHDAVCDKDPGLSNSQVYDGLPGYDASVSTAIFTTDFTVSGGKLGPPSVGLDGDFSDGQRRSPAMGRKLARGQSFTVTTTRILDDTSSQTTVHGTASISISLRRR